jgi:hypothetical protein
MSKRVLEDGLIYCQSCGVVLAERTDGILKIEPKKVPFLSQSIANDVTRLTLSCPSCSCFTQIDTK